MSLPPKRQAPPPKVVRGTVGLQVGRTRADPDELVVTRRLVGGEPPPDQGAGGRAWLDPRRLLDRVLGSDAAVLGLLLAVAAALRLPGLETRGRFGGDQGVDLLVLRSLTQDGVIPLLGPRASVGDFHHGAFIYYLLAPSAWLSGAEPFAVVLEMALLGIVAVAATWWMGRVIGGRTVGTIAGLLLAVSPAAVDESVFIWNPNPVPFFAAIAGGAAWKAHRSGGGRWWVVALGATGAVAQLHNLGLTLFGPVVALLLADLWTARRTGDGSRLRSAVRGLAGGLAVVALLFLPLAISELQTGFAELRGMAAYVGGGAAPPAIDPVERLVIVAFRVIGWPFVGLVTDAPVPATLAVAVVLALVTWHAIVGRGEPGRAARWLGGSILWSLVVLTIVAPMLANVTPGLPNDHYHAFVDPFLVVAVALAGVTLARGGVRVVADLADQRLAIPAAAGAVTRADVAARVLLGLALAIGVVVALGRQPEPDPNGGWPAVRAGSARIVAITGADGVDVRYLPVFEEPGDIRFGVVHAGGLVSFDGSSRYLVLGCDRLFESVLLATCGGQAEAEWLPRLAAAGAGAAQLVDRFDLSARVSISVYDLSPRP
ncbi:MAG TPA: glycosyltransferase family 39 protein [Candidatus Limnocylindrales bacterium]